MGVSIADVLRSRLVPYATTIRYDDDEEHPRAHAELLYEQQHQCTQSELCSQVYRQQPMQGCMQTHIDQHVPIPDGVMKPIEK